MKGVSIVICCFNSEPRIRETLESIQAQIVPADLLWEVILIDNNSRDKTVELSTSIWNANKVTEFRIIEEKKPGQAYARKTGMANAKYDYISFIDDDNRICNDWIKTLFDIFEKHPECAAIGGIGTAVFEKEQPFWFKRYQSNFAIGPQSDKTGYIEERRSYLYGAGITLQKKCYLELINNGFPEIQTGRLKKSLRGGGEDSELSFGLIILGYKLWYDERLKFDHYMPESRLTVKGLIELQQGFGRDEVILSIYRPFVCSFYKQVGSLARQYVVCYLRLIQYNYRNRKEKNPEQLLYIHIHNKTTKAYLDELMLLKKKFRSIKEQIGAFVEFNRKRKSISSTIK